MFCHCSTSKTTSLLQSAYSYWQIGPVENLHQFVEETLVIVGPKLEVFLQYALRFTDGLKGQLLISHHFLLIRRRADASKTKDQATFWVYPLNFCFSLEYWTALKVLAMPISANNPRSAVTNYHNTS